ncbi:hypothetical protein QJS10_CPA09g00668 [Acorus calamus]|uniref:Uncharacterized protein n=1 Tax=Acorus calamus TaxID=4465 RepID=A0AAV9E2I4_ACOCL|nr:hypothetical protein QJS10_CPA09g00668 [Acorus calamus]
MGLARLFHCFDWAPADGTGPGDIDRAEVYRMTMPKAVPLVAVARPRLPRHVYGNIGVALKEAMSGLNVLWGGHKALRFRMSRLRRVKNLPTTALT